MWQYKAIVGGKCFLLTKLIACPLTPAFMVARPFTFTGSSLFKGKRLFVGHLRPCL